MKTVAIIGTACRSEDQLRQISPEMFAAMKSRVKQIVQEVFMLKDLKQVQLVSGGSSFSDAVAVNWFLEDPSAFGGCLLYLPARFDFKQGRFDTSDRASYGPAMSLNRYHQATSEKIGISTLNELALAHANGAVFDNKESGFLSRNTMVAQSNFMVAFTFGNTECNTVWDKHNTPGSSGTADTFRKMRVAPNQVHRKIHVPLHLLHQPVQREGGQTTISAFF